MSILFSDIYSKTIGLFDDPKITIAYETNKIQYEKLMYSFLENAIGMFHNPSSVARKLVNYKKPKGTMEIFEGDGKSQTFNFSDDFEILANSKYMFIEGDKKVVGEINEIDRTITFPDILPVGQQYAVEQYYCGEFDCNFTGLNNGVQLERNVEEQVKNILARLTIQAWAEEQRNDYTETHSILTDTDFKLTPAYNMLKANNDFVSRLDVEINEMENRLAWTIRFGKSASYIGRG